MRSPGRPHRSRLGRLLWLGAAALLAAPTPSDAQVLPPEQAGFQVIHQMPFGGTRLDDVSADGDFVVGNAAFLEPWAYGERLSSGENHVIVSSEQLAGAAATNGDGAIAVGTAQWSDGNGSYEEAYRWDFDPGTGSGTLSPLGFGWAKDVSDDGSTIVGWDGASGSEVGIIRQGGTNASIGDLPGGGSATIAHAVDGDGSVVVGESESASGREAFRWDGGTLSGLGDLPGGAFDSVARDVTSDGVVVVGGATGPGGLEAVRWENGSIAGLGQLDGAPSLALGVSAAGDTIVGDAAYDASAIDGGRAFVWRPTTGMRDLREVLEQAGVDMGNHELWEATAVSADGRTIVGEGYHEDPYDPELTYYTAWVATLPETPTDSVEMIVVGDASNQADVSTPLQSGSVGYEFSIGLYEVNNAQYAVFLNAVAQTDTHGLYDEAMTTSAGGILRVGAPGAYAYSAVPGREQHPVNFVGLEDAMRFANWLHNQQASGAQDASTTEAGSYDMSATPPVRGPNATFTVPSADEWHKAAYYDPSADAYRDYPAGSDAPTSCTAPTAAPNTANCALATNDPAPTGSYPNSASPYGTRDQGGNVAEWIDTAVPGDPDLAGIRGGGFLDPANELAATHVETVDLDLHDAFVGFRVARLLPEPGAAAMLAAGALALAGLRRRR